jgi:hypothetical protein
MITTAMCLRFLVVLPINTLKAATTSLKHKGQCAYQRRWFSLYLELGYLAKTKPVQKQLFVTLDDEQKYTITY